MDEYNYEYDHSFYEPSENQVNDWNIHNDHQDGNEDFEEFDNGDTVLCDWCGNTFVPYSPAADLCPKCDDEYAKMFPHPLDIAEMEELENRSFGLDYPPWRGEF